MATVATNRIAKHVSQNGDTQVQGKAKGKVKKEVILNRPDIRLARLRINGISDLIVKQLSEKTQQKLVDKSSKASPRAKAAIDPHQEYLDSFYLMPGSKAAGTKGAKYGFPASGIKRSVVTAAGRFLKDGFTLNGQIVAGSLYVVPTRPGSDLVEINHSASDPYMRADQGRNPSSGGAVIIHRGAFAKWSMEFTIRYNASVLTIDQVATLFMWAGFSVGIGEWRPEKGGTYGQYEVATK